MPPIKNSRTCGLRKLWINAVLSSSVMPYINAKIPADNSMVPTTSMGLEVPGFVSSIFKNPKMTKNSAIGRLMRNIQCHDPVTLKILSLKYSQRQQKKHEFQLNDRTASLVFS